MDLKDREPRDAVGWMLGPDLVGGLSKIFDRRQDPRGWMPRIDGLVHDESEHCDGRLVALHAQEADAAGLAHAEAEQRRVAEPLLEEAVPRERDVVWFDYISDAGDSGDAMYAVAVACLANLDTDEKLPTTVEEGKPFLLSLGAPKPDATKLPRGQFLFFGGDTAYHIADEPSVRVRVEEPFRWADEDLTTIGALPNTSDDPPRLYGIPANHDWYDNLDGFRVLFQRGALSNADRQAGALRKLARKAATTANRIMKSAEPAVETVPTALGLGRFARRQRGSYAGIRLPHDWQLWGLDIDQPIDATQLAYFESLGGGTDPKRLILCTPSPPIAFGSVIAGEEHEDAVRELGLKRAYDDEPLPPSHLRLDLSGDIHHYARYANAKTPNYLAIVSGLGGAFHHPSFAWPGLRKAVTRYPTEKESRERTAGPLLGWKALFVGSWIRVFPVLFTLLLGAASTAGGAFDALTRLVFAEQPVATEVLTARLGGAGIVLEFLVGTILCVVFGIMSFNATYAEQAKRPSIKRGVRASIKKRGFLAVFNPFRSYWVASVLFVAAGVSVIAFAAWEKAPRGPAWLDVGAFLVLALGFFGGPALGIWVAGKHHPGSKLGLGFVGLLHGAAQVVTPLLAAHCTTASIKSLEDGRAIGLSLVFAVAAVGVTWSALRASRRSFAAGRTFWVALFAIIGVATPLVIFWLAAERPCVHQHEDTLVHVARYAIGAIVAMLVGTAHLTWYFAVSGSMGGHNNEVGGAARITSFRQIIRFRLDSESLTGYVIRIHDKIPTPAKVGNPRDNLEFAIVDVFSLRVPSDPA